MGWLSLSFLVIVTVSVDYALVHAAVYPLAGIASTPGSLAAGTLAVLTPPRPGGLPLRQHLRNANLVFRTSRVIDARPARIYRRPGPAPGHGGRPRKPRPDV